MKAQEAISACQKNEEVIDKLKFREGEEGNAKRA